MREARKAVMTLAEASWEDSSGILQSVPVRIEVKSAGGARIRLKIPIAVGSRLRIKLPFEHFSGIARNCRIAGSDYLVGIQRDLPNSPVPNLPAPNAAPLRERVISSDSPVSTFKTQSRAALRRQKTPGETPRNGHTEPSLPVASDAVPLPSREVAREMDQQRQPLIWQPKDKDKNIDVLPRTELLTQPPPKEQETGKERKPMQRKWLGLTPWHKKHELTASGHPGGDGNDIGNGEKENLMSRVAPPAKKTSIQSARDVPGFQVELLPMEDIYCAAGVTIPRKGYSIKKVVEMLHSEHICGLSNEMKRAAVLLALDAASVPIDEVLRDAKARQDALDFYEAGLRKQIEAEGSRKSEENVLIQAELESIKAHYTARISRNLDGVARDKVIFDGWRTTKQEEAQSMAEAVQLCLSSPVSERAKASPSDFGTATASAKPIADTAKNPFSHNSMAKAASAK